MASAFQYVFVHGFRRDVPDPRGALLEKRFRQKGIELHQLDAKGGKRHEDATVSIGLETLGAYHKSKGRPLRLIGISMGGLMSALYASRNPSHVDRIILLNPAVNLKETWRTITDPNNPAAYDEWKRDGVMTHTTCPSHKKAHIPFSYVEDSLQYESFPNLQCPSLVFVGSKDELVPPKNGYVLQSEQQNPNLMEVIEVEDTHDLELPKTVDKIWKRAVNFFKL